MNVTLRPIRTHAEYLAVEDLQRAVWHLAEVEIVPNHLLLTAQENGGLVIGAFDAAEHLVGFVFGFVGLTDDGRTKHCSHMAGVHPDYQSLNIGYRLKLAQRERVLSQGLDLITWTFDPLESRNARLNFHKLGVICRTYRRDFYGVMRDGLNAGLPSDRFRVDWHIASEWVMSLLDGRRRPPTLSTLLTEGAALLNRVPISDLPRPPERTLPPSGDRILIQIPAHFQAIKAADLGLARAWREHTRALFETAFAAGYTAVDLLFEDGSSYYLLQKHFELE